MLLFAEGALAGFLRHQTIWIAQVRLDPACNWAYPLHRGLWESHLLEAPDAASATKPKSCFRETNGPHGFAAGAILLSGEAGFLQGHQPRFPGASVTTRPTDHRGNMRLPTSGQRASSRRVDRDEPSLREPP